MLFKCIPYSSAFNTPITTFETSEHFLDIVCQCFGLFFVDINSWKQGSSKPFTIVSSAEEEINQDTRSIKDLE